MSDENSLTRHHIPTDFSDRVALAITKLARFVADTFFAGRYGHRAVVLETIAACFKKDRIFNSSLNSLTS